MVKIGHSIRIAVISWMLSPIALADWPILSVKVASDVAVRIKPCEPVFVMLDVVVASSPDQGTIREIPRELSRHVMVNDREYGSLGRGANAAALFVLNKSSIKRNDDETIAFQVIAWLYWNIEDEDFLFTETGRYRVRFHPEAHVDVVVEQPTEDEQKIIAQMRGLGFGFAKLIMGPDDNRAGALSPEVEQMLEEYPDTAYTRHLSISLGMYKFWHERPKPGPDHEAYMAERRKVKKYFEPYCQGEIKSLHEASAAYMLAVIESEEAGQGARVGSPNEGTARRKAIALLEKVKASPYAVDFQSKAEHKLRELRKADSTP